MSAPAYLPDLGSGCVVSILPTEARTLEPGAARLVRDHFDKVAQRGPDADGFYAGLVRELDAALAAIAARPSPALVIGG